MSEKKATRPGSKWAHGKRRVGEDRPEAPGYHLGARLKGAKAIKRERR